MATRLTPAQLLEQNHYCVLSTCDRFGTPWSTPLFYTYDDHWQVYWISALSSRHSRLIAENPQGSVVIYQPPGVSAEASALFLSGPVSVCTPDEVERGLELYFERTGLGVSGRAADYLGESLCRIYRMETWTAYTLGEPEWEGNLLLDKRVEVPVPGQAGRSAS
ncbi:pyridoxamine 5'-phosphate oxidase family protein [Parendozoicomonas haliclonae]|uniref:Pyridoxamine 5'-phosphate oxidase n=2 Tax=Parendozoicomonas haliclonae TaxID=1960125 RepID=A0A1X7ASS5_9GAMM|nr:Pyridoxamine 5'-phosphate oxidase [Parendozoicomonas haliclonae]